MIRHSVFIIMIVILLPGCMGRTKVPEDHFYKLPVVDRAQCQSAHGGTLAVAPLMAYSLHSERALLYIDARRPLEIKRYHYHHWMESPTRLIQEHLIDFLQTCKASAQVIPYVAGEAYDVLLKGKILSLERIIDDQGSAVEVALELELSGTDRRFRSDYRVKQPVNGASIHATVNAIGIALERIYQNFTADMQVQLTRNPPN